METLLSLVSSYVELAVSIAVVYVMVALLLGRGLARAYVYLDARRGDYTTSAGLEFSGYAWLAIHAMWPVCLTLALWCLAVLAKRRAHAFMQAEHAYRLPI